MVKQSHYISRIRKSNQKILDELDKRKYKLYMLKLVGTKFYYVGVTQNIHRRIDNHLLLIRRIMCLMYLKAELKGFMNVHIHMSRHIYRCYKPTYFNRVKLSDHVTVKILEVASTRNTIAELEDNFLKNNNSKYMLNVDKVSRYKLKNKNVKI